MIEDCPFLKSRSLRLLSNSKFANFLKMHARRCISTSRLRMRFSHCSFKVITTKTQRNVKNAGDHGMWQLDMCYEINRSSFEEHRNDKHEYVDTDHVVICKQILLHSRFFDITAKCQEWRRHTQELENELEICISLKKNIQ